MRRLFLFISILLTGNLYAQKDISVRGEQPIYASLTMAGIATSNNTIPFWMRTNQYGSMPLDGLSASAIAAFHCDYHEIDSGKKWYENKWDCAVGVQGRINAGYEMQYQLIEAYLKAKYSIFQLSLGRTKDIMGLVDTSLSSGAFAVSGNALGIPKIELSIPKYWNVPLTRGVISIKGNFAFGYVGKLPLRLVKDSSFLEARTFYHQKSLYGRIGKDSWKLKLYGGFNHQVFWGDEKRTLGKGYNLSGLKMVEYVVLGKAYQSSKVGNHIGSLDQAISYDFKNMQINAYHQFFYDVGGLAHLNNIKDGLWGLSVTHKIVLHHKIEWKKILVEFLSSKSQGGELTAKISPSGDEDYYNNYAHYSGWTYQDENIGNNFFTNKKYQRKDLPAYSKEYIGNSRITLVHLGVEWQYDQWSVTNRFSFSRNYGTYATSPIGNTTGKSRIVQPPPYFYPVNQFSGYLEASRPLKKNYTIGFVLAGDYGDLLYNSVGGMVKLTKTW